MYRMHVFGPRETGMHWQIQKGGGFHYHRAEQRRQDLEVAVALGTDPALMLASIAALPEGMDEAVFAAFLRGSPTSLQKEQPFQSLFLLRRNLFLRASF